MIYSERTSRNAVFIDSDDKISHLHRVPFMNGSFNEAWLQKLIAENPSLLQSEELGPEYSQLVCIGREVEVGSAGGTGYIDNLYVSSSGQIVVVETKLFRNQEARRTVIAQIIDYAKEVHKWDAEKLDQIASNYTYEKRKQAFMVFDLMLEAGYLKADDRAWFTDSMNYNLEKANFLLLIVGDGIRSGVQQIADFLTGYASLPFKLVLMELEVYKHTGGSIVIPNLLTKTTVIERTVFTSSPSVSDPIPAKASSQSSILSRQEFINVFSANGNYDAGAVSSFIKDLEDIPGISTTIHPSEIRIRLSLPNGSTAPLLVFGKSGASGRPAADIWLCPQDITSKLVKAGLQASAADCYLDFFKAFINQDRCKHLPYSFPGGFYYAHVRRVLANSNAFMEAIEQLKQAVGE